jgi:hypothetical protein
MTRHRWIGGAIAMGVCLFFVTSAAPATADTGTTTPAPVIPGGTLNGGGVGSVLGAPGGTGTTLTGAGSGEGGNSADPTRSDGSRFVWRDEGPDGNYECSNGEAVQVTTTFRAGHFNSGSPRGLPTV